MNIFHHAENVLSPGYPSHPKLAARMQSAMITTSVLLVHAPTDFALQSMSKIAAVIMYVKLARMAILAQEIVDRTQSRLLAVRDVMLHMAYLLVLKQSMTLVLEPSHLEFMGATTHMQSTPQKEIIQLFQEILVLAL